ncbi:MAG: hypothetical protein CMN76_18150 [Spirochaetaceae bacterium]|nr:hypothetical protein [Spirochaetaceae bacterium]
MAQFLFCALVLSVGCAGEGAWQILKQDNRWMAQITRMNLGPDEYFEGEYKYGPQKESDRFVWVHLNLTNQTGSAIQWDHTKVVLKSTDSSQDPFRVLKTDGMNQSPIKETESIPAGASVQRILIFSFPRSAEPESIVLGPLGQTEIPESILFNYQ